MDPPDLCARNLQYYQTPHEASHLGSRVSVHTALSFTMPSGVKIIPFQPPTYHPIRDPVTSEWGLAITRADYDKLLQGFRPRDMDDKWLCITDKPDAHGNTTVHWYRSWTDTEQFAITMEVDKADKSKGDDTWARFSRISWEREVGSLEVPLEEAKESIVNLSRGYVGCKLEKAGSVER